MKIRPPSISVVMAVRNGAAHVRETLGSLRAETDPDMEILVVDDGSTDETAAIVADAGDPRIRILRTESRGLTAALQTGCAAARGEFIARQDCGDLSVPPRLAALRASLAANPAAGFACGATEFVGPAGERLFVADSGGPGLISQIQRGGPGPSHHGATMFRRDLYNKAGGYRTAFRMAQDWDLWLRLIEISRFLALDEIQYRARVDPLGISMTNKRVQDQLGRLAENAHHLRASGLDESPVLEKARELSNKPRAGGRPEAGFYFIGSLLAAGRDKRARRYFLQAALVRPTNLKAWLRAALNK